MFGGGIKGREDWEDDDSVRESGHVRFSDWDEKRTENEGAAFVLAALRPLLKEYLALPSSDGQSIRQALRRKLQTFID